MIRKLLIVFASGLVLSILLLSAAWIVGGKELIARGGNWDFGDHDHGPRTTRNLAFDGSQVMTIDVPVNLRFTRSAEASMKVEGPESLMSKLRWEDGRLFVDGKGGGWRNSSLDVTISAPQLVGLVLHGAGDIDLADLDQEAFSIDAAGAVDLDGQGKVRTLAISSRGAGDIDLAAVEARDATIDVAGAGDVDISASGKVTAEISGVGNVTLHRKPTTLTSRISGVGSIDHDYEK